MAERASFQSRYGREPKVTRIDFGTVRTVAQRNVLTICHRVIPGGKVVGGEYVTLNPKRADKRLGSFKVNLTSGRWADFASGERGGDLISLVAWRYDVRQAEAARRLASFLLLEA